MPEVVGVELEPGDMLMPLGVEDEVPGLVPLEEVEFTDPPAPAPVVDMEPAVRPRERDPERVDEPVEPDVVEPV